MKIMLATKFAYREVLLAFVLLALVSTSLHANMRKNFKALETSYERGRINEIASQISTLKPSSNEEKAFVLFLRAMVENKSSQVSSNYLQQAISSYPNTKYGQLCMLQQAKLFVLERRAEEAKTMLDKINSSQIPERYYWLAVCEEMADRPSSVISNAENYQRLQSRGEYLEESYYLIVNAYMGQGKFQSAISTLSKLAAIKGYPTDAQYFHYLLGLAYQRAGNWQEALSNYQQGMEITRYSQVAYMIEDQIFELKAKHGSKVDLSFLYPYQKLEILEAETSEETEQQVVEIETPPADTPLKLTGKPGRGLYLQTGRFGVEANARSIAHRIRGLKLPSGYYEDRSRKDVPWVTFSGPFKTAAEQDQALNILKENQIDCFKIRH